MLFSAHPVLFTIFGLTVYAHGLLFALGAEAAYINAHFLAKSRKLQVDSLGVWVAIIFLVGLISARIGFFITYPSLFHSLLQVLAIWQGGLVSYFGIVGGLLMAWYLIRQRADRWLWLDIFCLSALLAWSMGRWGNYWAGDAYGILNRHWEVFYGRVPIQLFESLYCFIVWLFLSKLWHTKKVRPGIVAYYTMAGYLVGRFIIDTWREETTVGFFHLSQVVSLGGLITLFIFYHYFKSKRHI